MNALGVTKLAVRITITVYSFALRFYSEQNVLFLDKSCLQKLYVQLNLAAQTRICGSVV